MCGGEFDFEVLTMFSLLSTGEATSELAKAMRSRKAARGPLSHFEGTIAQFYKYLARTLAADRAPAPHGIRGCDRPGVDVYCPSPMSFGGYFLNVAAWAFSSAAIDARNAFMRWPTGYCSLGSM